MDLIRGLNQDLRDSRIFTMVGELGDCNPEDPFWDRVKRTVRGGKWGGVHTTYLACSARSVLTDGTRSVGISITVIVGSSNAASSSAMASSSVWDS